ncbi:SusC/RagA family TonB-linked outer membrane protein [Rufibacter tibetensis]|uniref:SusC/RagA family TonB-linked outer membrane protein n=1 Tax=Rufibacter tibetensis TaxID=512763 RepID=A0A0P0C954_9BACT|nr:TonB-dependent receptor [Rufibacter tibetensis]ALJ00086.1 SusC/RagA family TonB-linked outer membrane protein [Rufibacter tibetensis]
MQQALLKKSRYLLVLTFFFTSVVGAFAQTVTITGKVTDDKKEGLPGVTVLLKGTTTANATDVEGNYSLAVPNGTGTLVFSYIGFVSQEVPINGRTNINLAMVSDSKAIDEVVVVGYGTVTRKELTGSVASVTAKDIQDIPVSTAAEALAGRLAGVQVTSTEGRPGADIQVRVRGGGSLTQDNSPLYIVDGIQMENALSIISPQEIESVDVLKDAASTSIYGARGANGVVIITTKGGREQKTQVTYTGFAGVRKIVNKLEVMNPYDYAMYQYESYNLFTNANDESRTSFRDRYGRFEDLEIYKSMPMTDWQDRVFGRDAFSQTHVLGVTGGSKETSFNFTLNHAAEEGIMINSGYERTLASFKFDHKVTDRFKVGLTTRYSRQRIDGVGTSSTGSQANNRLRNAVRFRPFIAPGFESQADEFDVEYASSTQLTSPVLLANNEIRRDYRNDIIVNGWFSYDIIKNLTFRSVIGVNALDRKTNDFSGTVTALARQNNDQPVVDMTGGEAFSLTNSNTLTYKRKIAEDHNLDFLLGHELVEWNSKGRGIRTRYLPVDITPEQAFAGVQKATAPAGLIQDNPTTSESSTRLLSFFGRVGYNYKGKYFANFNLRRDGSSLFADGNRYGTFPSASLMWRVADESFMESAQNWLSDLKVRLSVGSVGNNRIGVDLFRTMYMATTNDGYAFNEAITPGYVAPSLANANLVWESTLSKNLGVDFAFFQNRLTGSIDAYQNRTKDLLLFAQIPSHSGYPGQLQNIGETENKGIELQLGAVVVDKGDFRWNANFNIARNRNKIVSLGLDPSGQAKQSYLVQSGWVNSLEDFKVEVGQPIGQFFGYVTDGYYTVDDFNATFNTATNTWTYVLKEGIANSSSVALGNRQPQPGDLKLKDLSDNNSSLISTEDRTVIGNAQPKFTGGFNQQFSYKGFDLSVFMVFSYGNKVYNANKMEFTTQYTTRDNNMLALMNDRFKLYDENGQRVSDPEQLKALNANAKYWRPSLGNYFLHSFAIEDGSFLRISNLTLGYSIPEAIIKRTRVISKLRVYATVNNLHTFTKYTGYDPEANTRRNSPLTPGVDYAAYPRSRYILGGINVTL